MTKPALKLIAPADWRGKPLPTAAEAFESSCRHRAAMVRTARLKRHLAIEAVQRRAGDPELIAEIGQDRIQEIIGRAFE